MPPRCCESIPFSEQVEQARQENRRACPYGSFGRAPPSRHQWIVMPLAVIFPFLPGLSSQSNHNSTPSGVRKSA